MNSQELTDADPAHKCSLLIELGRSRICTGLTHDAANC